MIKKSLILTGLSLLALTTAAEAKSKFLGVIWWPSHWYNQDFQPYYETSTEPHNTQWNDNKLSPQQWTAQDWVNMNGGNGKDLIRKWYVADILRDQYMNWGKPYVTVGPNFYHLGGADKERVIRTMDSVYKFTDSAKAKTIFLEDFRTDKVIGVYTKSGLDLQ